MKKKSKRLLSEKRPGWESKNNNIFFWGENILKNLFSLRHDLRNIPMEIVYKIPVKVDKKEKKVPKGKDSKVEFVPWNVAYKTFKKFSFYSASKYIESLLIARVFKQLLL